MSIDDGNHLIEWWHKQLESTEDWNTLPKATKKRYLESLKACAKELIKIDVTEAEFLKIIQLSDIPTVFECMIETMVSIDPDEKSNKYKVLKYLTKVVANTELGRLKQKQREQTPEKLPERRGEKATLDYVTKYDPYNFKDRHRHCSVCGREIRSDNATGVCFKCQQRRKNGD